MKLAAALSIAERIRACLAPHCARIEIAGSIRRNKAEVGDVEIVCILGTYRPPDLFSECDFTETRRNQDWIRAIYSLGRIVTGHPIDGRYILVETPDGVSVDVFVATEINWGWILALRTGSADYAHYTLLPALKRNDCTFKDGTILRNGKVMPVPEETDVFKLAGMVWCDPEARNA